MKVKLITDDGSEELVVPAPLVEHLSTADGDDEMNAAAVVGDLTMVAAAQQAKRLADHDHGGQDRDPEEVKVLAMELFEERFGRSYAEIASTANGAEEQVDPDHSDPSTSDEEQAESTHEKHRTTTDEQPDQDHSDPSADVTEQDDQVLSFGGRVAGGVLAVLLGLSLFSFVTVDPVHPITGLATLGGCLGAALVFPGAAVRIAGRGHTEHKGIVGASMGALRDEPSLSVVVIAYGSVMAFVYPTLFRIGGTLLGSSQWVFGPIGQVPAALLSAVLFAALLGALSYGLIRVFSDELRQTPPLENETALLAVSHAVYAVAVFVATGLSSGLWYQIIPSA